MALLQWAFINAPLAQLPTHAHTAPSAKDTIIGYCIEAIKLQQMTGKRFLSTSCAQDKVLSPHNKAGGILHGLPTSFMILMASTRCWGGG